MNLQIGLHITQANDPLQKVPLQRIHHALLHPKPDFKQQIERLRMIRTMDMRQYKRLKTGLPYFVCGHFHPAIRKREHFSSIQCFVVDMDGFEWADCKREDVIKALCTDERLLLLFTSPGGDGLKAMFRLQEACQDAGLYSAFYKAFIQKLALQYGLEKVIDTVTSDVSRACFLSFDPNTYYQPDALPVVLTDFFDPSQEADALRKIDKANEQLAKQQTDKPDNTKAHKGPSDEVLLAIKQRLNPNFRPKPPKAAPHIPERLHEVMPAIIKALQANDMLVLEEIPISYGKQIKAGMGHHWAEVNVFYGKRGFSVVKSTKTGSQAQLAELMYQIIHTLLFT